MKVLLFSLLLFVATNSFEQAATPSKPQLIQQIDTSSAGRIAYKNSRIKYKIITIANHTYGYDIFVDGNKIIHQPTIPCMPGQQGFSNKKDADKVAQIVINKIKKGIMPPTITKQEIERLRLSVN